jgi:UV DNA damage repair endonuclease
MQLNKLNQEYCTLLGKTVMPFLVIEYAQTNLDNIEIFNFKGKDCESGFARANNKLYQFANPKNKDTIKFIKNVEKEFQKVTKLNNNANLKLSLYHPPEQEKS